MISKLKTIAYQVERRIERALTPDPDFFLSRSKGLIHVGANLGQEREIYASFGLNVIWVEPIPDIFNGLAKAIAGYPKQKALNYLITDVDGKEYPFHISDNQGASSSIFEFSKHRDLCPNVNFAATVFLKSVSLTTLLRNEKLDLEEYDALVLDTQGSELLVLRGAISLLPKFRYVKTEVANFEAYTGCCQIGDLDDFMNAQGFRRVAKRTISRKRGIGSYFDVVYSNLRNSSSKR